MTSPVPRAALPAECAAADAAFRAVLGVAGGADAWSAPTRQAVLAWLSEHRDLVAAVEGKVLTAERDAGTWALRGDRDLAGFVGRETRAGRGAGMAAVAQAGTLAAMPTVADALVDGPVTTTHIAQITRATAASPALAADLATAEGQERVVELAGRLDGSAFGKALQQLGASLDPAMRQRTHDEQRANRFLNLTHTPSGTLLKGRLDTVVGHELGKALQALSPRPTIDDERTGEQRRADALATMVRRVLGDKDTMPGAVAPVQAVLTLSQETWAALRTARDGAPPAHPTPRADAAAAARRHPPSAGDHHSAAPQSPSAPAAGDDHAEPDPSDTDLSRHGPATPGSAADLVSRLRGVEPVTDESGQAWPASEIARALCDCALTRAVVGAKDADLNLGREARGFKRQHWMALYAAGISGCSILGCGMPLADTELHHVAWWYEHGGRTDLANCLPYCSFHHHEIHRKGIVVNRLPDGRVEHRYPDGRVYGEAPPDARPRPAADDPPVDLLGLLSA
ncbi:DUF222 domain-containing protein [Cellulomonas sp. 73-92]|uniref:DUF222 domain-containing protein n=1 Tax=Cellulomonas sp. 73-92 TaxID=1895740 RepID=UPI000AEF9913|nr:DUF222 domain-containing protein [Cellulomonas sp. 73-92]